MSFGYFNPGIDLNKETVSLRSMPASFCCEPGVFLRNSRSPCLRWISFHSFIWISFPFPFSYLSRCQPPHPGTPLRPGWPPASISVSAGSGPVAGLPGPAGPGMDHGHQKDYFPVKDGGEKHFPVIRQDKGLFPSQRGKPISSGNHVP